MMNVAVSDDPENVYLVSCFEYHTWNHCRLAPSTSYAAQIKGATVEIIEHLKDKKGKDFAYRTKYHIDSITAAQSQ
jgi:hypothetical protein